MQILTAEEVKQIDRLAVEEWNIPSSILMENAGSNSAEVIKRRFDVSSAAVTVLAGTGNNGGDGLVVSRKLIDKGANVTTFILGDRSSLSPETERNAGILEKITDQLYFTDPTIDTELGEALRGSDLIIDALFGIGIQGPVRSRYLDLFDAINSSKATIIGLDLPSGLPADTSEPEGACINADLTITMGFLKRSNLLFPARSYCGDIEVVSVGYPNELIHEHGAGLMLTDDSMVSDLLPQRKPESHKGHFGRLLIVAGSPGMTGAATLAASAGIRSGAGLVYLAVPESLNPVLETKLTETITIPVPGNGGHFSPESLNSIRKAQENKDAIIIGPGLSTEKGVVEFTVKLVQDLRKPTVLDADGLNALAQENKTDLPQETVLTPHPGELGRLIDRSPQKIDKQRMDIAPEVANRMGVVLVLKGVPTVVASPSGRSFVTDCPNSGLAKGGSGDVLTGLIGSFLAQGLSPLHSAIVSTWIHCRAGMAAAEKLDTASMTPTDVIENLHRPLKELNSNHG